MINSENIEQTNKNTYMTNQKILKWVNVQDAPSMPLNNEFNNRTIDETIQFLQDAKANGFTHVNVMYGNPDDDDSPAEIYAEMYREETDSEFEARLRAEENKREQEADKIRREQEKSEAKERAELERLKAKYESNH